MKKENRKKFVGLILIAVFVILSLGGYFIYSELADKKSSKSYDVIEKI